MGSPLARASSEVLEHPHDVDFAVGGHLTNLLRFDISDDLDARAAVAALVRRAVSMLPDPSLFGV